MARPARRRGLRRRCARALPILSLPAPPDAVTFLVQVNESLETKNTLVEIENAIRAGNFDVGQRLLSQLNHKVGALFLNHPQSVLDELSQAPPAHSVLPPLFFLIALCLQPCFVGTNLPLPA